MTQKLLTARQVKDLLDVDTSTIYRMAGDGRLTAVKIGRQWRFPAEQIDQLLNGDRLSHSQPSTTTTELAEAVVRMSAKALGVMMVLTDMDGLPLTDVANPCRRFEASAGDPNFITECAAEWRDLANDPDLRPRFRLGVHGFECARSFVRSGPQLVGMVLVGGVAPDHQTDPDLFVLNPGDKEHILAALPDVAALISRIARACGTLQHQRSN